MSFQNTHRLAEFFRFSAQKTENFFKQYGALAIVAFAVVYYALYFNAHLTLTGEAGSNVLIAQRMLEGWRPMKDMFIGYNLMWFYPLVWIFEYTGPSLLASRIYFIVLCSISGLLGFLLVRRVTGLATLAAIAGGLMILMPGAMYRNNVGFVGTLASFALIYGYIIKHRTPTFSILWMGFSGAAMSLCFLIRIEPSLIAAVVWMGLVILYPIGVRGEFIQRLRITVAGTLLALVAFAALHAPFVVDAYRRGFGAEFSSQYAQFVKLLQWELQKEIQKIKPAAVVHSQPSSAIQPSAQFIQTSPTTSVLETSAKPKSQDSSEGRRQRPDLSEGFQDGRVSFFPLALYFPILCAGLLTVLGSSLFLGGVFFSNTSNRQTGLAILTTTGCALALFPQYFFFRPDSVHLAEFMVPFYPALAVATAGAIELLRVRSWFSWIAAILLLLVCVQVVVAFNALFGREGSGSIRIGRGKTALFEAPGGIRFRVKPEELADWQGLRNILSKSLRKGDYLVTYPYVPLLNVMAQTPSYQFKLYVDNATESMDFPEKTIRELRDKMPAVVVVNNRDINKTESSRFNNWAAPVHQYLLKEYFLAGTYFSCIEVFVSRDRVEKPLHPQSL